MLIAIKDRLHPVSHRPGVRCLVPGSTWALEAFPTLLRFYDLVSGKEKEVPLDVSGPVHPFTVEVDVDKCCVRVFGQGANGYMHFTITCVDGEIVVAPKNKAKARTLHSTEKLSLGANKALDWDLVIRRREMQEIFPQWVRLAASLPKIPEGSFSHPLVDVCQNAIEKKQKVEIVPAFLNLFEACFSGILVPSWTDERHQGLIPETYRPSKLSPLLLLQDGARSIRSLFYRKESDHIYLLPCLPPEFHSGRFVGLDDFLDIEWSKKLIRRAVIRPKFDGPLHLHFQKEIRSFRMRTSLKDRGRRVERDEIVACKAPRALYLDNFQK